MPSAADSFEKFDQGDVPIGKADGLAAMFKLRGIRLQIPSLVHTLYCFADAA